MRVFVERQKDKKAVDCRWIKYQTDDTLDRYKAMLVAKGYIPMGLIMRRHLLQWQK